MQMLIMSPDSPSIGFFIVPQKFMVFFDHVHVSFVFGTACIKKEEYHSSRYADVELHIYLMLPK